MNERMIRIEIDHLGIYTGQDLWGLFLQLNS